VSKNNEQDSTPYVPKTDEERNEAFRLLEELEKESARQQAFREALAQSLSGLKPPVAGPRRELSPEEQERFNQTWGAFMHPERQPKKQS
jgi:hypothetical protein